MGLYFQRVYSASENEIKSAVFTMNKVDSEIDDAPGLEDIGNLFPPSSSASPSPIANVSMELPTFWADAAEV